MSTPSNLGLRRLVEYDRRNSPLLSLLNAPTVGDTASEAPADKPVAVQADFPDNSDNNNIRLTFSVNKRQVKRGSV
jgi:hypothetical protein